MTHFPAAVFRPYGITVFAGWILLGGAGFWLASQRGYPLSAAAPLIAAFLIEYAFYLFPGFRRVRETVADRIPILPYASLLAFSAVLPYSIASLAGGFQFDSFLRILVIGAFISFWYVFRRPSVSSDALMLVFLAAIPLSRIFKRLYVFPVDEPLDVLGQLMLIRLAATVMLTIREVDLDRFGFWPNAAEWKAGLKWFVLLVPVGISVGLALGFLSWGPSPQKIRILPLQFAGFLWVVALGEEFFFRGLVQQWIENLTGKAWLALALASLAFGAAHLPSGGFPNWKFALVASIGGVFYGLAYRSGLRAAMVTHALTATLLRTLFRTN
ncbi:MAG: type II CAAX prenyl endopeptidase Rce1 family protein [Bryobacteraceae bacterium]